MSFLVRANKIDSKCTILNMYGRLTEADAIRDTLSRALEEGACELILDLGEVTYIGSFGLGALTSAYKEITERRGNVRLTRLTKHALSLLVITKLATVFKLCKDEEEAFASMRSEAALIEITGL